MTSRDRKKPLGFDALLRVARKTFAWHTINLGEPMFPGLAAYYP